MFATAIKGDPSFASPYVRLLATLAPPVVLTSLGRAYISAIRWRSLVGRKG